MGNEIYFTRHGESTANTARVIANRITDVAPLTPTGRRQAAELLRTLRSRGPIAIVYASPLMRARQTADIIVAGLEADIRVTDALREPCCGELEGRGDDGAWSLHAKLERAWQGGDVGFALPGGESLWDVERRFRPCIGQLAAEPDALPGNVLVVSHGSILMNLLPRTLSNIDPAMARANPPGHCNFVVATLQDGELRCVEWCGVKPQPA